MVIEVEWCMFCGVTETDEEVFACGGCDENVCSGCNYECPTCDAVLCRSCWDEGAAEYGCAACR